MSPRRIDRGSRGRTRSASAVLAVALLGCAPAARPGGAEVPRAPAVDARIEGDPSAQASRRERVLAELARSEAEIGRAISAAALPGMSLGVVVDGQLVWTRASGVADVTTGAPVDADTVFRVGSITKTFTGLALMKLRDDGKLGLDEPVARYVPELTHLRRMLSWLWHAIN